MKRTSSAMSHLNRFSHLPSCLSCLNRSACAVASARSAVRSRLSRLQSGTQSLSCHSLCEKIYKRQRRERLTRKHQTRSAYHIDLSGRARFSLARPSHPRTRVSLGAGRLSGPCRLRSATRSTCQMSRYDLSRPATAITFDDFDHSDHLQKECAPQRDRGQYAT